MNIDFDKGNGLVPAIIQHYTNKKVLMLGYMNAEAYQKTKQEKLVTFYSRKKNRLWTKGETSGNFLNVRDITVDCDNDTLLIQAIPVGNVCHTGAETCFGDQSPQGFLYELEQIIHERIDTKTESSYTYNLFQRGINKIAQKVGEEAVELIIEAKDDDGNLFKNEAADLLYHFLILLKAKSLHLRDIDAVLKTRNNKIG